MMFKQQLKSEAVLQQHSIAENAWKKWSYYISAFQNRFIFMAHTILT